MDVWFFREVCRVGIFLICAQALVQLRPEASYEKYLKLLVGAMVLIQLFLPLGNALAGEDAVWIEERLDALWESMEQSMEEAKEQARQTEERLEQMTMEAARRMEEQLQQEDGQEQGGIGFSGVENAVEPIEPVTVEAIE